MFSLNMNQLTERYPRLGYVLYFVCVQYFFVQALVASHWVRPYNLSKNTISDLGNTKCGQYGSRYVCSPWHSLMNISFVLLGLTMLSGSLFAYYSYKRTLKTALSFGAIALGGLGTIIVGFFPENSVSIIHAAGATLPFLVGNIGLISLSLSLKGLNKALSAYAFLTGLVSICALPFFLNGHFFSLGQGGIERIAAYPQPIFLIIFGICGFVQKARAD